MSEQVNKCVSVMARHEAIQNVIALDCFGVARLAVTCACAAMTGSRLFIATPSLVTK